MDWKATQALQHDQELLLQEGFAAFSINGPVKKGHGDWMFIELRTPQGGEKSSLPQQDPQEGQLAGGNSNCSSDLPPCSTLAMTTGR
eukprot:143769-Rhodomonas_salina.3